MRCGDNGVGEMNIKYRIEGSFASAIAWCCKKAVAEGDRGDGGGGGDQVQGGIMRLFGAEEGYVLPLLEAPFQCSLHQGPHPRLNLP